MFCLRRVRSVSFRVFHGLENEMDFRTVWSPYLLFFLFYSEKESLICVEITKWISNWTIRYSLITSHVIRGWTAKQINTKNGIFFLTRIHIPARCAYSYFWLFDISHLNAPSTWHVFNHCQSKCIDWRLMRAWNSLRCLFFPSRRRNHESGGEVEEDDEEKEKKRKKYQHILRLLFVCVCWKKNFPAGCSIYS